MADLNALLLFAKVVDAKGFSEAARRLKVPVSTVSRRIAELEDDLGVRLLERTTRRLRLTEVGSEIFEHAQRSAELSDAVDGIVSDHRTAVSGTLRLSAPPSISDSLLAPLVTRFQAAHPGVHAHLLVSERPVDPIVENIDLSFHVGPPAESSPVARRLLVYRHQLVASPAYLAQHPSPMHPRDLLSHRLLAFSRGKPHYTWTFQSADAAEKETIRLDPYLAMNDYASLAAALVDGRGIGDLPPIVQPGLLATGQLVEVMPAWHFRTFELTLVHLGNRMLPRHVRLFIDFAAELAPTLFPSLPV